MDVATARQVIDAALEAEAALKRSLLVVKASGTPDEYEAHKAAAGMLIGRIFTDVVRPLYQRFPELAPDELKPSLGKPR
jgi:hypothetical protein